jgi:hypothetical protein
MANALYDKARQRFLTADLNWSAVDIKALLVDTASYTVNLASDEFVADIPLGMRIKESGVFLSKTVVGGAADAADSTFVAVAAGAPCEAIVIYQHTGSDPALNKLIAYIDTATGLPITPNGGDIIVTWDNGPNKIFKL